VISSGGQPRQQQVCSPRHSHASIEGLVSVKQGLRVANLESHTRVGDTGSSISDNPLEGSMPSIFDAPVTRARVACHIQHREPSHHPEHRQTLQTTVPTAGSTAASSLRMIQRLQTSCLLPCELSDTSVDAECADRPDALPTVSLRVRDDAGMTATAISATTKGLISLQLSSLQSPLVIYCAGAGGSSENNLTTEGGKTSLA
jgi:hypothetical protein